MINKADFDSCGWFHTPTLAARYVDLNSFRDLTEFPLGNSSETFEVLDQILKGFEAKDTVNLTKRYSDLNGKIVSF